MKKKKSKESLEVNSIRIAPKEYVGYILLVGFLCVLMFPGTIFIIITLIQRGIELKVLEGIIVLILPIGSIIVMSYLILTVIKICRGKVFLEISNEVLKFSGIIFEKHMSVYNIKTIKRVSGVRQLTSILIVRKTNISIKESRKIRFPLIWFADRDVENFLEYLNKTNKKIEWIDF